MASEMDKELKKRLTDFTREPDERLWENIAPHIVVPKTNVERASRGIDLFTAFILGLALLSALLNLRTTQLATAQGISLANIKSNIQPRNLSSESAAVSPTTFDTKTTKRSNAKTQTEFKTDVQLSKSEAYETYAIVANDDQLSSESLKKEIKYDGRGDAEATNTIIETIGVENEPEKTGITSLAARNIEERVPMEEKIIAQEKTKNENEQEIISKERAYRNFNIYITAMPTFGYQRIESKTNDQIWIESVKKISAFSTRRLGVRVELGAELPVSKRLKLFGGVLYYQRKQTIDYVEIQPDTTRITSGPNGEYIVETTLTHVDKSFEYELKNIGIQIGFNYQLRKATFLQSLGTGLEFQFALNKLADEHTQNFTNNPSAYVFYNLYYRLQYPSEGRLKAVFQPTLNYSFYINQNLNAPFYVKPYGLGLNIGLTYNF